MKNDVGKIAIIGLGYVGLPLAVGLSKKYDVIGFDINSLRIKDLKNAKDVTNELTKTDIACLKNIKLTFDENDLVEANQFIVTVPTPIKKNNDPDMSYLIKASELVSKHIKKGTHIIYESTVYPGATEEVCLPILQKNTNLEFNQDFFLGYSPERINPGDKKHKLENIVKVTSGSNDEAAEFIDDLYNSVIDAGTFKASSIKVAEAAKVIENTQRDLNIALMNELSVIFRRIGIDTNEVLEASRTKWNFLDFRPGLVGGHCIGVDPYYLTFKSKELGYVPKIILAGRDLNNEMSNFVAKEFAEYISNAGYDLNNSKILILGLTFKENCPDTRNSKVFDLIEYLNTLVGSIDVYDPWANEFNDSLANNLQSLDYKMNYHGIILAVGHEEFIQIGPDKIKSMLHSNGIFYDLKSVFKKDESNVRL